MTKIIQHRLSWKGYEWHLRCWVHLLTEYFVEASVDSDGSQLLVKKKKNASRLASFFLTSSSFLYFLKTLLATEELLNTMNLQDKWRLTINTTSSYLMFLTHTVRHCLQYKQSLIDDQNKFVTLIQQISETRSDTLDRTKHLSMWHFCSEYSNEWLLKQFLYLVLNLLLVIGRMHSLGR